jgi:hypothetical protein
MVVSLFLYSKNMIVFLVSDYLWLFILADKIHSKMGEGRVRFWSAGIERIRKWLPSKLSVESRSIATQL